MANVKQIHVQGHVPYDWMSSGPARTRAFVASLISGPSMGTRISYGRTHMVPTGTGGQMTMYSFVIEGAEALRFGTIEYLIAAIERLGGQVDAIEVNDIEDGHDHWYWTRPNGNTRPVPDIDGDAHVWALGDGQEEA